MNALYKSIWDKFNANTTTGFYNALSGRMYLNQAPQETSYPYCVYFLVSDVNDLDFSDEHEEMLVQFSIYSENQSALEAGSLLEDLKSMYDDCNLTVTDWRHIGFQREFVLPANDTATDPPTHGYHVQYRVELEKTR